MICVVRVILTGSVGITLLLRCAPVAGSGGNESETGRWWEVSDGGGHNSAGYDSIAALLLFVW